jgi:hypothetical protein
MIESIADRQPAIVVNMGDYVHVISIVTLRQLANGEQYNGEADELIRILSRALVDLIDEQTKKTK